MKKMTLQLIMTICFTCLTLFTQTLFAQVKKEKMAVLNIDSRNLPMGPQEIGDLVRMELEKLDSFEVMDRYDVKYILEKKKINYEGAFGKESLVEIGNLLNVDYILSGTVEKLGDIIVVTYRLINVKEQKIAKTHLIEFVDNEKELSIMVKTTLKSMFNKPIEEIITDKLTKRYDYDNQINNPNATKLSLGGPRMGVVMLGGQAGTITQQSLDQGGFAAYPVMSQLGYQFEIQYLNAKRAQALLEIVPLLTGIEQRLFKFSISILNGIRDSKKGWEFAFGPMISTTLESDFVNYEGKEMRASEYKLLRPNNPLSTYKRLDSKGDLRLDAAMVIAVGKTFKSGKLNIPVNLFFSIPTQSGFFVGLSFGYNVKSQRS